MRLIASSKRSWLLRGLGHRDRIVEIGPSYSPMAPKRDGWQTFVIDHASREELVGKFSGHGLDVDSIEEVDRVWQGEPFDELIPETDRGSVAAVLASHVLEHMPDPLGFLCSCESVLADDGVVALAVPDQRRCFDLFRPPSTTAAVVQANRSSPRVHSWTTRLEWASFACEADGQACWPVGPVKELRLVKTLQEAWQEAESAAADGSGEYVDAHAWVFTPASFRLIMLELRILGLTRLRVDDWVDQGGCEFLVRLVVDDRRVDTVAAEALRLDLMRRTLMELGEAAAAVGGQPLPVPQRAKEAARRAMWRAKRRTRGWQKRRRGAQ